ncbi:hypothetical protein GHI93_06565 [Lactococcus hircilactis]|uniref:Uncharacterized protein n=3 Tax=Lactobacillales TaxID=186826 RepID=A0A7X2D1Z8_9LACT|nr:hypothetical protein [Lactococcus hircilactis]MQW39595.1 hypothetical protein [Lactococcus hircilactis]
MFILISISLSLIILIVGTFLFNKGARPKVHHEQINHEEMKALKKWENRRLSKK